MMRIVNIRWFFYQFIFVPQYLSDIAIENSIEEPFLQWKLKQYLIVQIAYYSMGWINIIRGHAFVQNKHQPS